MYYMYLIRSRVNESFYVGSTNNLKERFIQHKNGESTYTKRLLPWNLIYYEAYPSRILALRREKALKKRAKAWQGLLKRLEIER